MAIKCRPVDLCDDIALPQKRIRIGSLENSNVLKPYRATQPVPSSLENASCSGKTNDNENQEDADDDDADRSLLYCILSSVDGSIDLQFNYWYETLTNIRNYYKLKHRSREEDILAIQSMTETSRLVKRDRNIVKCFSEFIVDEEDDCVYNCLTFNKNYVKFMKVTPTEVLQECVLLVNNIHEYIMSSNEISSNVLKFGLDFIRFYHTGLEYNEKHNRGLKILNLPNAVVDMLNDDDEFGDFKEYVNEIMKQEQKSLKSLHLNSLLGSYLIGRETGREKALNNLALSHSNWSILVSILMSESYSLSLSSPWKELLRNQSAFPLLSCDSSIIDSDIAKLTDISKVLYNENSSVRFISDDIRHQVMSYFVKNCLITNEDYENYIKLSSVDSLLEYVQPWWYMLDEHYPYLKECLFLPHSLEDSFFQRLGLDVLRHPTIDDEEACDEKTKATFREKVKDKFNVPEEIFDWEYDARCRYIECAKRGTKTVHRARAMIVGCAGAGKTTLLKRLQKLGLEELLKVYSTVGLEVHEDMFELDEDSCLRALLDDTNKDDKKILSVVDFGGQCAYYACHQVYLSRRAFYILVMDMSKPFTETVDKNKCEQRETMFTGWTYGGN
ncbi:uncharacterized protein LOC134282987 [Saccostrea cucullata]|uniref:uncharacterized protein LOC134282987 n=1 Tax=Saccostrea cuccullata TaxID=36930 RepID=UPI002ED3942E